MKAKIRTTFTVTTAILAMLCLLASPSIKAQGTNPAQSVLVINVHGPNYDEDGYNVFQTVSNAGANATYVNLDVNGKVASLLQTNQYAQVWVFDLSHLTDDYPADWQAIANWYQQHSSLPIICDARILSSFWNGRWVDQGQQLAENYYVNLAMAGGGLMLGTDHDAYQPGINTINALIGLTPFSGFFALATIPVDATNPLMNSPNDLTAGLADDSTPGQVPYGLQPNGRVLYPIAWQGGNEFTPGISTTLRSISQFRVGIPSPANGSQFAQGAAVTLTATHTNGLTPVQYNWKSDRDGALGAGSSLVTSNLSAGAHIITVVGVDNNNQVDVASVTVNVVALTINIAHAVEIWWPSVTGRLYQVQWASELAPAVWSDFGPPVLGNGTTNSVFDSTRQTEKRFYRIILP
ncbi:MAG: hypothetical protein WCF18_18345 [Chthoniobacteraceae bacterium]